MSADTHVHNLTPAGAAEQMKVEDIDYVNLMFIGEGHPLWKRGLVTGRADKASTADRIVFVSQEVRDANQGHLTLLGMREPIRPIQAYTGRELNPKMKVLPNEPLNWDVCDRMRAQKGLAFHAHYLFWPGYGSPVAAALGKLDGLEWCMPDIVRRGSRTRQNIRVKGFGLRGGGPMWYDMLNCGARIPLVGGTDKMSAARVVGGSNRTYAKVAGWDHTGFMAGLRSGATFVSNGPLLQLTANGRPIGSDLRFAGDGPAEVRVEASCTSQRPIKYFELIRDGKVVVSLRVPPGRERSDIVKNLTFARSGWLAARARHDRADPENWERAITAAHSSPIYVTVAGKLPAVKGSAEYLVARMDMTLQWAEKTAVWSTPQSKARAMKGFEQAREFYGKALSRAVAAEK